jgi:subtilisin-like proprotein convertase family protein
MLLSCLTFSSNAQGLRDPEFLSMAAGQARSWSPPVAPPGWTNSSLILINDNTTATPYPANLVISGYGDDQQVIRTICGVIGFTHTSPSDVQLLLISPGGQTVKLLDANGGSTSITNLSLIFDDFGATFPSIPLLSARYRPEGDDGTGMTGPAPAGPYGLSLDSLTGSTPNGTWSLYALDNAGGDSGAVSNGFWLQITTASTNPPASGPLTNGTAYETNLYAYFKCEEGASQTVAVDSVYTNNLAISGMPAPAVGIVSNGWNMNSFKWQQSGLDAAYDFAGHDFTIRAWIRPGPATFDHNFLFREWTLKYNSARTVTFISPNGSGIGDVRVTNSIPLTTNVWHRVIAWSQQGVGIGLRVDDGTNVTAAQSSAITNNIDRLVLNRAFNDFNADEIGIWKDHVLTDGEATADWNSGAGVTYPLP